MYWPFHRGIYAWWNGYLLDGQGFYRYFSMLAVEAGVD